MSGRCIACGGPMLGTPHDGLTCCPDCGQWASSRQPALDNEGRKTALDRGALGAASMNLRSRNLTTILAALSEAGIAPGARLLDVGSGDGLALAESTAAGFEAEGIEPDTGLAKSCRVRGHVVSTGCFPDDMPAADLFDVILFNHTLEHIADPRDALTKAVSRLTAQGVIVVHSPSARGPLLALAGGLARLGAAGPLRRMWWSDFPSPLLHRFSPTGLSRIAESMGLATVRKGATWPLQIRGLWRRLGAARDMGSPSQALLWLGLVALTPLLRLFPRDYFFLILRRK